MREAARVISTTDAVDVIRRYIHLRRQLGLPRIYNHPHLAGYFRIGDRVLTLGQLAHRVTRLEQQARRQGMVAA